MRRRVYEILEAARPGDRLSLLVDVVILGLIVLNVAAVVLETVRAIDRTWGPAFAAFETLSVGVFTAEYVLRLWSAVESPRFEGEIRGRLRFLVSPMGLVDLVAILPYFVVPHLDLRSVRVVRLFRLFRLAKVARYSTVLRTFGRVLRAKKEEMVTLVSMVVMVLVVSSALMYYVENPAQPEAFSSMPAAMWWGVATLTTVGYGDAYPITPLGKILASVIAVVGIGLFALPAGILGSAFVEDLQARRRASATCPHCGKELSDVR